MRKLLFHTTVLLLIADMLLALSGFRVKIDEKVVQPGEHYVAGQFGDLAEQKSPSLVCRYWTGINTSYSLFEYGESPSQHKSCPWVV